MGVVFAGGALMERRARDARGEVVRNGARFDCNEGRVGRWSGLPSRRLDALR